MINKYLNLISIKWILLLLIIQVIIGCICIVSNVNAIYNYSKIFIGLFVWSSLLFLTAQRCEADCILISIIILLINIGILLQSVLEESSIEKIFVIITISTLLGFFFKYLFISLVSFSWIKKNGTYLLMILILCLYIILFIFGNTQNGARAWLFRGSIQVTEITKFLSLCAFSLLFSNRETAEIIKYKQAICLLFLNIFCLFIVNELGTAIIIAGVFVFSCYLFLPLKYTKINFVVCLIGIVLGTIIVIFVCNSQNYLPSLVDPIINICLKIKTRFLLVFNPSLLEDQKYLYQCNQASQSIILGQWFGSNSSVHLPNAIDDYALISLINNFGFVTTCIVMLFYFFFIIKALHNSLEFPLFKKTSMIILTLGLAIQTSFIFCACAGIFPLSGMPLAFISNSGTYTLTSIISVIYIIFQSKKETYYERKFKKILKKSYHNLHNNLNDVIYCN